MINLHLTCATHGFSKQKNLKYRKLLIHDKARLFYFLVLGSADPIFLKTRIKIKVTLICFIFIFSTDLNFPPQNEIKVD